IVSRYSSTEWPCAIPPPTVLTDLRKALAGTVHLEDVPASRPRPRTCLATGSADLSRDPVPRHVPFWAAFARVAHLENVAARRDRVPVPVRRPGPQTRPGTGRAASAVRVRHRCRWRFPP